MGMLHVYCGNGKGKTTAALGLAVRAAGAGMSVFIAQFMKGSDTSELVVLKCIENITLMRCERDLGFVKNMTQAEKEQMKIWHNGMLYAAFEKTYDMIIFDEFFSAYNYGLMDKEYAEEKIFSSLDDTEIVLTGRDPDEKFIKRADYVSEILSVKHPFEKGIRARKGIEF